MSTGNVVELLKRQGFRCALTGRELTPESAALDHIVPIRCGGQHVIANTQVLHKDVNRAKCSLTNQEFVAICAEVVRWAASLPTLAPTLAHVRARSAHPASRPTPTPNATCANVADRC